MSNALTWGETPTSDDKLWGLVAHASVFVLPWFGAIIMFLLFKDKAPFVRYHAIQSLVFQIAATIIGGVTCGFGFILFLLPLWGAYKAYQGEWEGYPLIAGIGK